MRHRPAAWRKRVSIEANTDIELNEQSDTPRTLRTLATLLAFATAALLAVSAFPPGTLGHNWDWGIPETESGLEVLRGRYQSLWHEVSLGHPVTIGASVLPLLQALTIPALFGFDGAWVSKLVVVLTLFVGACCAYFWVRQRALSARLPHPERGAFLAGAFYGFSPYLFCDLQGGGVTQIVTYALIPLAPWSLERALRQPSLRRDLAVALVLALLSFSIQRLVLATLISAIHGITCFGWRSTARRGIAIVVPFAALQLYWWLPVASQLGALSDAAFASNSEAQVLNLRNGVPALHDAWVARGYFRDFVQLALAGPWRWAWELALLGGALPIVVGGWRSRHANVLRPALLLLLASLPWVTGALPPFGETVQWCYQHVPLLNLFRSPQHFLILPTLALATLLGLSCAAWQPRHKPWAHVCIVLCLGLALPFFDGQLRSTDLNRRLGAGNGVNAFRHPQALLQAATWLNSHPGEGRVLAIPPSFSPYHLPHATQSSGQGGDPFFSEVRRPTLATDFAAPEAALALIHELHRSIVMEPEMTAALMDRLDVEFILERPDTAPHFDRSGPTVDAIGRALPTVPGIACIYDNAGVRLWQRIDRSVEGQRVRVAYERTICEPQRQPQLQSPSLHRVWSADNVETQTPVTYSVRRYSAPGDPHFSEWVALAGDESEELPQPLSGELECRVFWRIKNDVERVTELVDFGSYPASSWVSLPEGVSTVSWSSARALSVDVDGDSIPDFDTSQFPDITAPERWTVGFAELQHDGWWGAAADSSRGIWAWRQHRSSPAVTVRGSVVTIPESPRQTVKISTRTPRRRVHAWHSVTLTARCDPPPQVQARLSVDFNGDDQHDLKLPFDANNIAREIADGDSVEWTFEIHDDLRRRYGGIDPSGEVIGIEFVVFARDSGDCRITLQQASITCLPTESAVLQDGSSKTLLWRIPPHRSRLLPRILSPVEEQLKVSIAGGARWLPEGTRLYRTRRGYGWQRESRAITNSIQKVSGQGISSQDADSVRLRGSAPGQATVLRIDLPTPPSAGAAADDLTLRMQVGWRGEFPATVTLGSPPLEIRCGSGSLLPVEVGVRGGPLLLSLQTHPSEIPEATLELAQVGLSWTHSRPPFASESWQLSPAMSTVVEGVHAESLDAGYTDLRGTVDRLGVVPRCHLPRGMEMTRMHFRVNPGVPPPPVAAASPRRLLQSSYKAPHYREVLLSAGAAIDLVLAERYASGWQAWIVRAPADSVLGVARDPNVYVPTHFLANGFENAWGIESGDEPIRVALIYAPQLWTLRGVYAGLVLLCVWVCAVGLLRRRGRRWSKSSS